jgi:hypothetical protein
LVNSFIWRALRVAINKLLDKLHLLLHLRLNRVRDNHFVAIPVPICADNSRPTVSTIKVH